MRRVTNELTVFHVSSEDTDQPEHQPDPTRVLTVHSLGP